MIFFEHFFFSAYYGLCIDDGYNDIALTGAQGVSE